MMSNAATGLFLIILMLIGTIIVPDVVVHGAKHIKSDQALKVITETIEHEGTIDSSTMKEINESLQRKGLNPDDWEVSINKSGNINYRDSFVVNIDGEHTYTGINFLGTELGYFTIPIQQQEKGYSNVYFR